MIEIKGLNKNFGDFAALSDINLSVAKGEFLVVLGPSGAGKSTLLRCINRLTEPSSGKIIVCGQESSSDSAGLRKLRCNVAMIFQHYNVVPRLMVLKNVLTGRLGSMPSFLSLFQIFPKKDIEIAWECLKRVELLDKARLRTDTLSGGQKQRVGIARALAQNPKIIFADEPTGNLDSTTGNEILSFMRKAVDELGQTIVMVTHDPVSASYADRIVFLKDGKIAGELLEPTPELVLDYMKKLGH